MAWVRLDDMAPIERRHRALSDAANWTLVCLLAYSNREPTDGLIDRTELAAVRPGVPAESVASALAELVKAGAVEATESGWRIVWHLAQQPSSAEIVRSRKQAAERQRRKREYDLGMRERDTRDADHACHAPPSRPVPSRPEISPLSTSGEAARAARRPRWTRFPSDYAPTDADRDLARQLGLDLAGELAKLRDHEFAKPRSDAAATLRNWLRRAADYGGGRTKRGPAPVSTEHGAEPDPDWLTGGADA